jgi:hypothetical protein
VDQQADEQPSNGSEDGDVIGAEEADPLSEGVKEQAASGLDQPTEGDSAESAPQAHQDRHSKHDSGI